MEAERLLTVREVARMFRVTRATVRAWASSGRYGAIRTPGGTEWRFPARVVQKHLEVSDDEAR
jgi:excisionase family DNA binding protein